MSISDLLKKIKGEDVFIVLVIILIGLAGFGLGKLSALEKNREPVQIIPTDPKLK